MAEYFSKANLVGVVGPPADNSSSPALSDAERQDCVDGDVSTTAISRDNGESAKLKISLDKAYRMSGEYAWMYTDDGTAGEATFATSENDADWTSLIEAAVANAIKAPFIDDYARYFAMELAPSATKVVQELQLWAVVNDEDWADWGSTVEGALSSTSNKLNGGKYSMMLLRDGVPWTCGTSGKLTRIRGRFNMHGGTPASLDAGIFIFRDNGTGYDVVAYGCADASYTQDVWVTKDTANGTITWSGAVDVEADDMIGCFLDYNNFRYTQIGITSSGYSKSKTVRYIDSLVTGTTIYADWTDGTSESNNFDIELTIHPNSKTAAQATEGAWSAWESIGSVTNEHASKASTGNIGWVHADPTELLEVESEATALLRSGWFYAQIATDIAGSDACAHCAHNSVEAGSCAQANANFRTLKCGPACADYSRSTLALANLAAAASDEIFYRYYVPAGTTQGKRYTQILTALGHTF